MTDLTKAIWEARPTRMLCKRCRISTRELEDGLVGCRAAPSLPLARGGPFVMPIPFVRSPRRLACAMGFLGLVGCLSSAEESERVARSDGALHATNADDHALVT